ARNAIHAQSIKYRWDKDLGPVPSVARPAGATQLVRQVRPPRASRHPWLRGLRLRLGPRRGTTPTANPSRPGWGASATAVSPRRGASTTAWPGPLSPSACSRRCRRRTTSAPPSATPAAISPGTWPPPRPPDVWGFLIQVGFDLLVVRMLALGSPWHRPSS